MLDSVVLVVYGWKSVQPGTLAWVFPSVAAAAHAARTMTNAVNWAVVAGSAVLSNVDAALYLAKMRASGAVLLEQRPV